MNAKLKKKIEELFSCMGITINGKNPWDIQVTNEKFYGGFWLHPELALGEGYTEGLWECQRLDEFFYRSQLRRENEHTPEETPVEETVSQTTTVVTSDGEVRYT